MVNKEVIATMFSENLEHARHVENERITFISFYSAFVGVVIAFIPELENLILKLTLLTVVLFGQLLCRALVKRWNEVFKGHLQKAEKMAYLLQHLPQKEYFLPEELDVKIPDEYDGTNRLYYFKNDLGKKRYLRTAQLFDIFNVGLILLIIVMYAYVLIEAFIL